MPRHSKAFLTCQKTLLRSLGLVDLYTRLSKEDVKELGLIPEQAHVTDLIRSSVVLTVSAMDAYFTNRFTEMLVPYIKRRGPTRAMVKLLHSAGLNAEQALIMAAMDRPYRRVRTLMQRHLERYVTQKFTAVDELFSSFGINDYASTSRPGAAVNDFSGVSSCWFNDVTRLYTKATSTVEGYCNR